MANKYIRHGETFNGDGTSSAAATVDGGVGAWNNINVFEGTAPAYGTLAAGDVVYIRSKDAAGADITRTTTAESTLGSTAAVVDGPITWIVDAGTVWPGISSVVKYTAVGGNYTRTVRDYNNIIAEAYETLEFITSNTWGSDWIPIVQGSGSHCKNIKINASAWSIASNGVTIRMKSGAISENLSYISGLQYKAVFDGDGYIYGAYTIINPNIVANGTNGSGYFVTAYAYTGAYAVNVIGGRVSGTATDNGMRIYDAANSGSLNIVGTQFPRTMRLAATKQTSGTVSVIGCDLDGTGGYIEEYWGWATSRTDNYPPTLSATLPDSSSTLWSWRVYPENASPLHKMRIVSNKLFTGAPATKTITQEILIANDMVAHKSNMWINVAYIDSASGLPKNLTTRDFAMQSLDTSTANWSSTSWGMIGFNKHKFSITTPTSIKRDTLITVALIGELKSTNANQVFFVDPDFSVI